jgi:hypothetical protein
MFEPTVVAEPMAPGGFRARALAALAGLLPDGDTSQEAAFLHACSASEFRYQHAHIPADGPLLDLGQQLQLHGVELLTVSLAAAVETDLMCGRAVAHLQAPIGGSRPTLGLLAAAFGGADSTEFIEHLATGAAVGSGLLTLLNDNWPLAERAVSVAVPLSLALSGHDTPWPASSLGVDDLLEPPLPASVVAEARRRAHTLLLESRSQLVLRSNSLAESRAAAREIASVLGLRPLFINMESAANVTKAESPLRALTPLLLLRKLLPVFCMDLGPGERRHMPDLPYYSGSALALCGPEGSVVTHGESPIFWKIDVPPRHERRDLWRAAIGDHELVDRLASDYRHGSGRIAQLGRVVRQHCLLQGRDRPVFADIASASWVGQGSGFETLAQPVPDLIPDEALVAGNHLHDELSRLLLRCRRRESLIEGLGTSALARYRPGVRVLFTGQSGTGKTLAAAWLATRLGLPLYRADLASITSKYIGETEKNLAQLLAHAEEAGVILLFDEADSLFGKRTEVKESNDRFANAQTNYLLQRIETFDGITLLTSNSRSRFDPAFCRRLDMIIEFPLPGPEERRLLWLSHLGSRHNLSPKELNLLAAAADLAGGHIRNAVLTAAVLAQSKGRAIEYTDIYTGLNDEYRKLGRQTPAELQRHT